jgi:c-di-GMP-binding flagellar brake protein YcgR
MLYDPGKLNQILSAIAGGFQVTPLQIIMFFLLLAGIALLFLAFEYIQRRKTRRDLARRSEVIFQHLQHEFGLNEDEKKTLGRMAAFLKPGEYQYTLLLQPHRFDACARRIRSQEHVSEDVLTGLRLKLQFQAKAPEAIPVSTRELPLGKNMLILARDKNLYRAEVIAQDSDGLTALFDQNEKRLPQRGAHVRIYYHSPTGIFVFSSQILRTEAGHILLRHADVLRRFQRRRYYRRSFSEPVRIRLYGVDGRPEESAVLDLGGGGASLLNPDGRFKPSDRLELFFPAASGSPAVSAVVLRTSADGTIAHVQFDRIGESTRDRILGFILTGNHLDLSKDAVP